MADEKKVFDVAKPGSAKPDTGSKPMVVGHKIMKDPTINNSNEETPPEEQPIIAQSSKITVSPVSEEFVDSKNDSEAKTSDENVESTKEKLDDNKQEEKTPDNTAGIESKAEDKLESPTEEEKKESEAEDENQREENLQKIIKEKTYNLPIEEASYSSVKTFIKTFFVVGILGLIVLVLLIDAEVIDLGITLPFDFL
jgi:hypothetical protein